ncbi:flagellar type III secretion system pore protein FliP [Pseudomonas putida]|uniref:flagellar type III secretion system pore protein FliP n=1 Tax=Pseudomonas putida TaxID=303 RepID=UPI0029DE6FF7|nr:flagellar type III secretion system pore protein FliP [Pseudomonas putida]EKT4477118.1 flagellar type III secretion system pore protein FliP [Pseudomonas putida]WPK02523.1 flagellar type III secretion system pore protein FliP [Pseudomonas putida]
MFSHRLLIALLCLVSDPSMAAGVNAPWDSFAASSLGSPISVFSMLTLLSLLPFGMIALTTFTRNIVVLSLVRHALGLQQTPPNIVLIVLALFLTLFVMAPTLESTYQAGVKPFLEQQASLEQAAVKGWVPVRDFMVRQTHESDLRLIHELAKAPLPATVDELTPVHLVPAFMLSELKIAFQIGFMIFLPFLIIDLIVSSILMSLGMIMVPPITLSLPLKIMLFLLIDGWGLITQTLVRSVV